MRGSISGLFQKARQGRCLWVQPVGHTTFVILLRRGEMLVNRESRWVVSGDHGGATRGADRIEDIELLKVGALTCESIQVRCF